MKEDDDPLFMESVLLVSEMEGEGVGGGQGRFIFALAVFPFG